MALEPPDGGGGGSTGARTIISQRPDILVVGTNVEDAITVTVRDNVYGITFSFTRSTKSWEGGAVQAAASFFASSIQSLAAYRNIVGLVYTQGVNGAGNLIDQMEVTVGTDDGQQAASFVWPLETIDGTGVYAKADAVYNQLITVAEST